MKFVVKLVELAYAGGLFTGEGCFTINRYKGKGRTWVPMATVKMTDLPPLERFQAAVGRGYIYGPYSPPSAKPTDKPFWVWKAQTLEEYQHVVAVLWPWLCPRRRARAAEVLDLALAWDYPVEAVA